MRHRILLAVLLLSFAPGLHAGSAADDAVQIHALDHGRLAREIFAETNRVRMAARLPAFRAEPRLDEAADTQAKIGALLRPPSHTNPFPLIATPLERVKFAGLDPERVAENIALLPVVDLPPGASIYITTKDATRRDSRTGEPVRPHTYASFARAIVGAWMNSPGHRANILDPKLHYLGCAARPAKSQSGVDMIFGVQAFYTPQRKK